MIEITYLENKINSLEPSICLILIRYLRPLHLMNLMIYSLKEYLELLLLITTSCQFPGNHIIIYFKYKSFRSDKCADVILGGIG